MNTDTDLHVAEHKMPALLTNYIESIQGIHDTWGQKLGGQTDFKIISILSVLKVALTVFS